MTLKVGDKVRINSNWQGKSKWIGQRAIILKMNRGRDHHSRGPSCTIGIGEDNYHLFIYNNSLTPEKPYPKPQFKELVIKNGKKLCSK